MPQSSTPTAPREGLTIYTVGHSNHDEEAFLNLLREHRIGVIVDTRTSPYSKYTPHFSKENLESSLESSGVRYLFLGNELGGRPRSAAYYDEDGYVLYERLAKSKPFRAGIAKVLDEAGRNRVALVCGEEDPSSCHRRLLVGRVLVEEGVTLLHIRGDGSLEYEEDLRRVEAEVKEARKHGQQSLFDLEEEPEWKSIRSVSPRRPPESFSGS